MRLVCCPFDWPEVTALFVGGCLITMEPFEEYAHAHNTRGETFFGAICLRDGNQLYDETWLAPSWVMWHEYAHILVPSRGHDERWRAMMRKLGQPIEEQYTRRPR